MTPAAMSALHAACFVTPRPWSSAEFSDLLSVPGVFVVGGAEGFALGRALAGEAELLTLAVHPSKRRQGRGRQLLSAFEAEAMAREAEAAFLEVAADNGAAIALYRRAGFVDAGRRPGYYRPPRGGAIDALVMRKAFQHV